MDDRPLQFDEIGAWSEVKLDIVRRYAVEYSKILSNQRNLEHYYIDGFAGSGVHLSRHTGSLIAGSPLNALEVQPPFKRYFLVDLDGGRIDQLRRLIGERRDVELHEGDCNAILLRDIFPRVRFEEFRRALCLLDPYGLQLNWSVLEAAGKSRTIDLFLNFPIMDMNRRALWSASERVTQKQAAPMTSFWGDESWRETAYRPRAQGNLFGEIAVEKTSNDAIVQAFRRRLMDVAGFKNVPKPMPMRNSTNAVVYYLFFASHKAVANTIVEHIFSKHGQQEPQ